MLKYLIIFVISCCCFFINTADAKTTKKSSPQTTTPPEEEKPYTKEAIFFTINDIRRIMVKGNDNKRSVQAMQLLGFSDSFDYFVKYEKIEKTTRVSRNWYKK